MPVQQEIERYRTDALYFERHRQEFLQRYPEHWIAVYNQKVVGTATLLAPRDALALGLDLRGIPQGTPSTGVGGRTPTVSTEAVLTLDTLTFTIPLRILAPTSQRQRQLLSTIPYPS